MENIYQAVSASERNLQARLAFITYTYSHGHAADMETENSQNLPEQAKILLGERPVER